MNKVMIIAEAGVNHNGNLDTAKGLIDAASNTFGVRLELQNNDHAIPGGIRCMVNFMPDGDLQAEASDLSAAE